MRRLWIVALVFMVGCGQPLRMAPASAVNPTTLPANAPTPPPAGAAPSAQPGAATPSASASATPTGPLIVLQPAPTQTGQQRWRAQQDQRQVFDQARPYQATAPAALYWFDPTTGQSLLIGMLVGPFAAQAQFIFRPSGSPALEVRYRINQDFGLTAISPALTQRMASAGYIEQVEAYVLQSDALQPQTQ